MAWDKKLWLFVLLVLAAKDMQLCVHVAGDPQVPCLFIFGDSLSDSGNNNNLPTEARANYLPYGIDFFGGPTGRFTNGRTSADILTQRLGFKNFIPPCANTSGSDILQGVNYASGAAGIRNETGTQLGSDVSLELQMTHHRDIISKIANKLGGLDKAQQHLSQCLYYFNIGSNDYLNNYFVPEHFPSSRKFNPEQYAAALIQQYSQQLRALHQTGARKFTLIGLGLVGCIPHEVKRHRLTACVEEENKAVLIFNDKLKALVDQFNEELSDSKFVFVNPTLITSNSPILSALRGFTHRCCEVLENGQCTPNKTPCQNRNMRLFMDEFHPTEIVNQVLGSAIYAASIPILTCPFDIRKLVKS